MILWETGKQPDRGWKTDFKVYVAAHSVIGPRLQRTDLKYSFNHYLNSIKTSLATRWKTMLKW